MLGALCTLGLPASLLTKPAAIDPRLSALHPLSRLLAPLRQALLRRQHWPQPNPPSIPLTPYEVL